ncbi:hypothetical protein WG66_013037 [Moniliophthora roreri]|nr:hypothetical protein WG66_013037 [Moniliophthora roreri]
MPKQKDEDRLRARIKHASQQASSKQYTSIHSTAHRIHTTKRNAPPPKPSEFQTVPGAWPDDTPPSLDPQGLETVVPAADIEEPGKLKVKAKAKRYLDSDAPLLSWRDKHREEYLDHIMMSEGRGQMFTGTCSGCVSEQAVYRCQDCIGLPLLCKQCLLEKHTDMPLHRIQEWKDDFFHQTSLRELGLEIQIGHRRLPGDRRECPFREGTRGSEGFLVLGWNGIHIVNLFFCGCEGAPEKHLQLLDIGWWPASYKNPQSAATFECLHNFHITNLQGKLAHTDFYRSLEQISDGSGLTSVPDREAQFMTMMREWRHIKTGKRFGRAHDPTGLGGTQEGTCAVPCRACPIPGVNLPENWHQAPASKKWLYSLLLAEDANFKQKARARPNDHRDVPLNPGWGCTVAHKPYLEEMAKYANQDEISHCVGFSAIWNANNKKTKGLRATGVGAVTCSRHEVIRPNGLGDLQVGERYGNMDYILLSAIIGCVLALIVISYDIACQWGKGFRERMKKMPQHLHLREDIKLKFKVPKFHLPAHVEKCFAPYAFNFTEGVGLTDGEGIERVWSSLNEIASSASMMTAGGRWDIMDDHCNHWNWRKTVLLPENLLKKLLRAISEAVIHTLAFEAFTDGLKIHHSAELALWESQVIAWEERRDSFCPYDLPVNTVTLSKLKLELAAEEHQKEVEGKSTSDQTISGMVIEAVDIEEAQRSLVATLEKKNLSEFQQTTIQKARTALLRRIRKFRDMQAIHMPRLARHLSSLEPPDEERPELIDLYLPSSFDDATRPKICSKKISEIEERVRNAQLYDCLASLRSQLRARGILYQHSDRATPSQGLYRRLNAWKDQVEAKIKSIRLCYDKSRAALLSLRGHGDWENVLRVLRGEDIRGIGERLLKEEEKAEFRRAQERAGISKEDIEKMLSGVDNIPTVMVNQVLGRGDSRAAPSWIWYTLGDPTDPNGSATKEIEASLRVEWCKARARARRAREELLLVEEEMRRALAFCHWRAKWWTEQLERRPNLSSPLSEGLRAYAKEQSVHELQRAEQWEERWRALRDRAAAIVRWIDDPKVSRDTELGNLARLEVEVEVDGEENNIDKDMDNDW